MDLFEYTEYLVYVYSMTSAYLWGAEGASDSSPEIQEMLIKPAYHVLP